MKKILTTYSIHPGTMALISVKHMEIETMVLEQHRTLFVKQAPFQMIKQACLNYCSSYKGRLEAVIHHTKFRKKVPIPIHPTTLYMFPTHAIDNSACCWINPQYVEQVKRHEDKNKAVVLFTNGEKIELPVTPYSLRNQIKRSRSCKQIMSIQLTNKNHFQPI